MSLQPQMPVRRSWIRRLLVVIVAAALLAGLTVWISGALRGDGQEPGSSAPPTAPPTEPTSSSEEARVANGCLGGQAVTAQTVLTAQQQAQLDDVGAAEFAATFARWSGVGEGALPPADEIPVVLDAIIAPNATESVLAYRDLADIADEARTGNTGSTADGGYYIESSAGDEVVVSFLLTDPTVVDADGAVWTSSFTMTLTRAGGMWQLIDSGGTRTPDDLASIMAPFSGGC